MLRDEAAHLHNDPRDAEPCIVNSPAGIGWDSVAISLKYKLIASSEISMSSV